MNGKRPVGILLVIISLLLPGLCGGCGPPATTGGSEFEVIRQAADAYLSSGKASETISAEELYTILTDGNKENDPLVLSAREWNQYKTAHLPGAIYMPWQLVLTRKRLWLLTEMATGRKMWSIAIPGENEAEKIVVYSYTGHEGGGQATALLNMLGYDASNLQWGFASWMFCPEAAPRIFRPGREGRNYPLEATLNEPAETYPFPIVENTGSEKEFEIIRAAGNAWFQSQVFVRGWTILLHQPIPRWPEGGPDIHPKDLFSKLHNPRNDSFILDVRDADYYAKGHIPGAINIPLREVAKPENLRKLPPDRQIVVCSTDGMAGSQLTGILNALGYDAINLLYGITGWTYDDDVAPGRFQEYIPGSTTVYKDIMQYRYAIGDKPGSFEEGEI